MEVATGHAGLIKPSTRAPFNWPFFNRDSAAVDGNRENSKIVDSPRFQVGTGSVWLCMYLCVNLSVRTALNLKATTGSAGVMIFDNLVVDNKRWHLSDLMLIGSSDSLRGQFGSSAVNRLLDYTTLKSVELIGLPIY